MVHLADLKTSGMEQSNRDASVPPPRLVKAAHEFERRPWEWLTPWRKRVPEDRTALAMVRIA